MVHRRSYGPARVQYIVEQNNRLVIDIEGNLRMIHLALRQESIEIISVESNVHLTERHFSAIRLFDDLTQPSGEEKSAGTDADKSERVQRSVLAKNGAGHSLEICLNVQSVQDPNAFRSFRCLSELWNPIAVVHPSRCPLARTIPRDYD